MSEHEKFEILCALATIGQISDADLVELKRHIKRCVDCQDRISDFAQISAQAMPLSRDKRRKLPSPEGMTARFVERARAQGIPLREPDRPLLPSGWSFGLASQKWSLAMALLLIAMIAGISKSVLPRSPSADTAVVKLDIPNERSIQANVKQNRSRQQTATKPLSVRPQSKAYEPRFVASELSVTRPTLEHETGSSGSWLIPPDMRPTDSYYQLATAFAGQRFWDDVHIEPPGMFQAREENSGRQRQGAPVLTPFWENKWPPHMADSVDTDAKERMATFSVTSLTMPFQALGFRSDRHLASDSPFIQSELNPGVDWYQVRMHTHTELLRISNYPSQYNLDLLAPAWPFSRVSRGNKE